MPIWDEADFPPERKNRDPNFPATNKVEIRFVVLGVMDGDLIEVVKGISDDDRIIVGNQQKIVPGIPVVPIEQPGKI